MSGTNKPCSLFRRALPLIAVLLCGLITNQATAQKTQPKADIERINYQRDIRPILTNNCFPCHGQDESHRAAGLRLDTPEGAFAKSITGKPAIVSGKPETSPAFKRIISPEPQRMPPIKSGKRLTTQEIAVLKRWIAEGATYQKHWAFQRPQKPKVPTVVNKAWVRSPIDTFILSVLERKGLKPQPEADRYTLIRRLSLDLIGLPPTPEEVAAFIADKSPAAYEKVVDRLLGSPHFGEKWARMWLDLARYADSAGYGSDPLRLNIWPYRDWVIHAFNRNLPYDQFTREQLAGDLLTNPTSEQLLATAFHRNTMTNTEGGTDDEEFRTAAIKDRAGTTMQVWMGLTLNCAQCHTHKFDPITQKEYYGFTAFFNQTEDTDRGDEYPTKPLLSEIQERRAEALRQEITALETAAKPEQKTILDAKKKELAAIKTVNVPILRDLPNTKARATHLLVLGNFLNRGEKVEANTPTAFGNLQPDLPRNRLGVANWLMNKENPLTARVAVNRFWAQLFGIGIVETEEDFGLQGSYPTHPELLDWLAVEFQSKGWNMKSILKTIVSSTVYRQSSKTLPIHIERDPRNRLLSRYPRRRLDAEAVRDQALLLSGLLSRKLGGPSVYPPQPTGLWQAAFNGERTWTTSNGEDRYRRGIYTFWRRTTPYPSMATFDAPSREFCSIRRIHTNTPLQSLVTLNDPAYLEMAQALARRIIQEGGSAAESRAKFALQLVLAKPAAPTQTKHLMELYTKELAANRADLESAKRLAQEPLGVLPQNMDTAEAAAWTVVANVLLNLDGVLTKH